MMSGVPCDDVLVFQDLESLPAPGQFQEVSVTDVQLGPDNFTVIGMNTLTGVAFVAFYCVNLPLHLQMAMNCFLCITLSIPQTLLRMQPVPTQINRTPVSLNGT